MEDTRKKDSEQKQQVKGNPATADSGQTEARTAALILLFSSLITNFIKQDNFFILASLGNIVAVLLLNRAARLESAAQQIAPGVTTFANKLKLGASTVSIGVSLVLFWALLIETRLKAEGVTFVTPTAAPTAAGTAGVFIG